VSRKKRNLSRTRWDDLSPGLRRLVVVGAAVEGVLKIAALIDLVRRPAAEVKGSKLRWGLLITLVNSLGAAPLAYFKFGRRKTDQSSASASETTTPEAERTVLIHRPPSTVFAYFADGENDPQWRPMVKEIARNGPIGPGMTYRQRIAGPAGRKIPSDFRVTEYEPDSHLAFEVTAGPVRPVGDYRFVPVDDGTEVTLKLSASLSGLKKRVMTKPLQQSMDSEVAALDRAKEILESGV